MSWIYNPFTSEFDFYEPGTETLFEFDSNGDTMPFNGDNIQEMELDSNDDLMLKVDPLIDHNDVYYELDSNYDIMPREP